MIAKFRLDGGWAYHECVRIIVNEKHEEKNGGDTGDFNYLCHTSFGKRVIIERQDGVVEVVIYDLPAYLMNDRGDTINAI